MPSITTTANRVQVPNGAHIHSHSRITLSPDHAFAISLFSHNEARKPITQRLPWRELQTLLTAHDVREGKDGPLFSPTFYPDGLTRKKANVESVSLLVLDFDTGIKPDEITPAWDTLGLAYIVYSTHSNTLDHPKWRAVFMLSAPVAGAEWESVYHQLAAALGNGFADPICKDASRIYYRPSCAPEYSHCAFAFSQDGGALNPADFSSIEKRRPAPVASVPFHATDKIHQRYVEGAVNKELDKLRAASNGDRNNQLNKSAFALGQFVGARVLDRSTIESELATAAASLGLPENETASTIRSGLNDGEKEPRQMPEPRITRLATQSKPLREVTSDEIPAPALSDEKGNAEYDPAQLLALIHPHWPVQNLATHAAHAQRIRDLLGADLCYNANLGWLVYNGRFWQRDDKNATRTSARVATLTQAVRDESATLYHFAAQLAQAGRETDAKAMSKAAAALLRHTKQIESKAFIEGALHLAAGILAVETELFDQKPWIIGFQNGTWDKGIWREHRREDYLLHLSPVRLDFEADRAEWMAVLERITGADSELALMTKDVCGYIFSAASHLRLLPFFYGPKGTGKSTVAELLQTVLGHMSATIDPKKLQDDAARERLGADLWNRRLAICAEAGSQRLAAELLKTLSGSDLLPVRFLFREAFTAPPRHVLLMVTNDPPRMDAYDDALKDRVIALPFVHALNNGAPLELTGGKRIEAVRKESESPLVIGFAAWAMEGLARVFQSQEIHRAKCVETATAQFWADTDPLTPFWETVEESELLAGIGKTELRGRYENWCETEGARPFNRAQWKRACESQSLEDEKRTAGKRFWFRRKVAQVAQVSTFPKDTRESYLLPHGQFENDPTCATCATNESEVF